MYEKGKWYLIERINKLEAEKSKLTKLVTFQRDTILNLRTVAKKRTSLLKELTVGI